MKLAMQIVGFVFSFMLLFSSCSPRPLVMNQTEQRQILIGKVVQNDRTAAIDAIVSLFDVSITSGHDSICNTYSTVTSRNGHFILNNVPDGNYLLYIYDTALGRCNLSQIQKQQQAFQLDSAIVLEPLITIKGRVIGESQNCPVSQALIPGFGASAQLDENGYFVLADVPSGKYEIVLSGPNFIEYIPTHINHCIKDTVFLDDKVVCPKTSVNTFSLNISSE